MIARHQKIQKKKEEVTIENVPLSGKHHKIRLLYDLKLEEKQIKSFDDKSSTTTLLSFGVVLDSISVIKIVSDA